MTMARHVLPVDEALAVCVLIPSRACRNEPIGRPLCLFVVSPLAAKAMQVRAKNDRHDGDVEDDDQLQRGERREDKRRSGSRQHARVKHADVGAGTHTRVDPG